MQNVFGSAVRFGQGVTLSRDAGLATTPASVPVLVTVVSLLDQPGVVVASGLR